MAKYQKISNAKDADILKFWSGLGYYSRAKNLLKSVKIISKKYKSKVPENYADLISLPGVGDYTAKAVLGIGYNKPYMPIDANIERIISRLYSIKNPLIKEKKNVKNAAEKFISKKNSEKLIQAFMDYGSAICLPKNPKCHICIFNKYCLSYKNKIVDLIPKKNVKKTNKQKKYTRAYVILNNQKEILVRKRSSIGMLASMMEVPNDKWVINKKSLVCDKIALKLRKKMQLKGRIKYSFSHFDLNVEVFLTSVRKNTFPKERWIKEINIDKSGLPTVMKKIVQTAL